MEEIISKQHTIQSIELGPAGNIRPTELMNHFQNLAAEHARQLGFGEEFLLSKGATWVLSRYHMQIDRYPGLKDEVIICSWPSGRKGLFSFREFEVLDSENNVIISASTAWLIIDISKRRPLRPYKVLESYPVCTRRAINTAFEQPPELTKCDLRSSHAIHPDQIDANKHVNHAVYLKWAIESLPDDFVCKYQPSEIEITYKSEVLFGQNVVSKTQLSNGNSDLPKSIHSICDKKSQSETARLRIKWQMVS